MKGCEIITVGERLTSPPTPLLPYIPILFLALPVTRLFSVIKCKLVFAVFASAWNIVRASFDITPQTIHNVFFMLYQIEPLKPCLTQLEGCLLYTSRCV